ncbi:cytochrome P450 family protein [Tieghemostelium lacteum]|uniref:Cytochrome P450 family protein n=1 Tax=Tieghemostelium lacteum TaxID=361077 RepID=A0A152A533_TIELA|nr:cytochrome P450 family protein [Tieghemostelium lacteum]|eukprot:KYR01352.1 cytochrome P450 family protein [Tieghemostelium lacteum]
MIFTKDLEICKYILSASAEIGDYRKPPDSSGVMIKLARNSILMSEESQWKFHRSLLSPSFTGIQCNLMKPIINQCIDRQIANLLSLSKNDTVINVDIQKENTKLTFDIIGQLSIGYNFKSIEGQSEISNHFTFILNEMIKPIRRLSSWIPLPSDWLLFRYIREFDQITIMAINHRKQGTSSMYKSNFLLDSLISSKQSLNQDVIIGNINTFLLAGHETSSNLLTFVYYLLCKHQSIQEELYQQINVLQENSPLLDWVINETLRLYPPAPMVARSRHNKYDDILPGNIRISHDTLILISIYAIHRDTRHWGEDANQFNPYRWKDIPDASRLPYFLPFSQGSRICIGKQFTQIESKLIISKMLQTFHLQISKAEESKFKIYQRATLTIKNPIHLILNKRL